MMVSFFMIPYKLGMVVRAQNVYNEDNDEWIETRSDGCTARTALILE